MKAYALWLILCEWTLLRNLRLTFEHAPDKTTGYLAASLWLLFSPYYLELYVGQFTFLTASLVFWAYLCWLPAPDDPAEPPRVSQEWGDACFSLGVWLKLMPLLYLPLALLRGRWKGVLVLVLVLWLSSWLYFAHDPGGWMAFQQLNTDPFPTWHAGSQGMAALLYVSIPASPRTPGRHSSTPMATSPAPKIPCCNAGSSATAPMASC